MGEERKRPLFRLRELLLLLPVLIAAAAVSLSLFWSPAAVSVRIERDGTLYEEVPFSSVEGERALRIEGEVPVTILVGEGYACFLESACPDQVCVRTGRITKAGETAVCLPARVTIRLVGSGGVDGVTY